MDGAHCHRTDLTRKVISRRTLLAGLGLAVATPWITACGGAPSASQSSASSGAASSSAASRAGGSRPFVFAYGTDSTKLDAPMSNGQETYIVNSNIYDPLIRFKAGTTELVPALAERWDASPDGLTYVFHLRKGLKFHDGSPVNGEAVANHFDRIINKQNPFHKPGAFPYGESYLGSFTEKVEAASEGAVKFTLKRPYSPFLSNLAIPAMGVVSMEALKRYNGDVSEHPSGAGPYRFVKRVQDDSIELEANPDYWAGKPKIDRVVFKVIKENTVRVLSLEKGEVDVAWSLDPKDMNRVRQGADTTVMEQIGLNVAYGSFNLDKEIYKSKQLRQGLNWAVNRDELARAFYAGAMVPGTCIVPPPSWAFDPSIKGYGFDPDKAKALIKESGYNGQKLTLWIYTVPRPYNPRGEQLAAAIQQYWKNVGVDSEIKTMEWASYLKARRAGQFDFSFGGWLADTGDPDNFLYVLLHSSGRGQANNANYNNPEYDRAVEEATRETDQAKRKALYVKAQQIAIEDAPWLFLGYTKDWVGLRKSVQGFTMNPNYTYYIDSVTAM